MADKVQLASSLILNTPPGQLRVVVSDIKTIAGQDILAKASKSIADYNEDQLTPCDLSDSQFGCLVSKHNALGHNRYADYRSKKSFASGKWRSVWTVNIPSGSDEATHLSGVFKIQVHYYEDGNVQLLSNKDASTTVKANLSKPTEWAKRVIRAIDEEETLYQNSVTENYNTMSTSTFKVLRRLLPITKAKIQWDQLSAVKIGQEIQQKKG